MLTLIPSEVSWRMAGIPSRVPGTLIITLGLDRADQSLRASAMVPSVSWARWGETSRLTNPSLAVGRS